MSFYRTIRTLQVSVALLVGTGLVAGGCASGPSVRHMPRAKKDVTRTGSPGLSKQSNNELLEDILAADEHLKPKRVKRGILSSGIKTPKKTAIPIEINERVRHWINFFVTKDRARFRRFLERGLIYRDKVESILKSKGMPLELYFLAMIESGYVTTAHSTASAVGIWQFIRGTGKRYGLKTNYYVDERRDPIRATKSASRYLRDLHTVFHDWYLAIAAYNAGEMRILGAIMRGKSRDFWELARKKMLPRETMNYVPKFLAAVIVGSNPGKFGFKNLGATKYPDVEAVKVPSPVRLRDIARLSGISYSLLKQLNGHLLRSVTPPKMRNYKVWVPVGKVATVIGLQTTLARKRIKGLRSTRYYASAKKNSRYYHRIKRGDTLSSVARKYRMSVAYLKRLNKLKSSRIRSGTWLRVSSKTARRANVHRYRVRKGDSLFSIAMRHGISVNRLKRLNKMRRNRIFAGQRLKVATGRI